MRFLRYLMFPALLGGLVFLGIWVAGQPRLHWPVRQQAVQGEPCPLVLRFQDLPQAAAPDAPGLEPPLRHWVVAESAGEGTAPQVAVRHTEVRTAAGEMAPACILDIAEVPEPPFAGLDWRIGHRLDLPAELRGRAGRAVFTAALSPDRAAELGGGSVYLYDGGRPVDTGLAGVEPGWRPIRVELRLDPAAEFVEIWYRLAYQGGISNPVSLIFADPVLTLLPADAATDGG